MLLELDELRPSLGEGCYVAPNATLIGDVQLGASVSIWFGAVLRGDNEPIAIAARSNIQDNAVLHADPGFPLVIEEDVTVGHLAMLHGCHVGSGSLIGIGATVLNGARIGRNCLIGARALVVEGSSIPDDSVVLGAPGKVVGETTEAHRAMMARAALSYLVRAQRYAAKSRQI
jgi:carbonic anhydrase/acetyltransferase-like protein (isoleucine patch superfamily)